MNSIASLSTALKGIPKQRNPNLRVCVVTSEFVGPIKNGGIGAATSGLVEQLLRDGHDVTLLYTLVERDVPACAEQSWAHWVQFMKVKGVRLEYIHHDGDYRGWRTKSWLVKDYIEAHKFDLVYFNEHHGSGYYSIAAKRAGIEPFASQMHCVVTHGSIEWVFDINDQYITRPADLEMMGLERRSVEWADVVIGPSRYILETYRKFGWKLPKRTFHQPLPLYRSATPVDANHVAKIDELVFFGRLETRKGLWLFCDALDRLGDKIAGKQITFLGRTTSESGLSTGALLLARSGRWPVKLRLLSNYGQEGALAYLRKPGRLAVMPSLADNSPCVIYECMENRIPFISTLGSGAQELVDERDWPATMVLPQIDALADKLACVLDEGARMARPAFDPADNLSVWSAWHAQVAAQAANRRITEDKHHAKDTPAQSRLIVVDSGCSLRLLLRNMLSNLARFGGAMEIGLITARRGIVKELLQNILETTGNPLRIYDPADAKSITEFVLGRPVAFFTDASCEIASPFVLSADHALRESVAVSCATVEGTQRDKEVTIRTLPVGDLVALSALGQPIGSEIWACRTDLARDFLGALVYLDPQTDVVTSSLALGQHLMHQARSRGEPFLLLPVIGGLVLREGQMQTAAGAGGSLKYAERAAAALGIVPDIYQGGAEWLGISSFGVEEEPDAMSVRSLAVLPGDHPMMRSVRRETENASPGLAAALGKSHLAFQLAASQLANAVDAREIADVLLAEVQKRPRLQLKPALTEPWEYGRSDGRISRFKHEEEQIPPRLKALLANRQKRAESATAGEAVSGEDALIPANVEAYIDVRTLKVSASGLKYSPTTKKARIVFLDVPLAGHEHLAATFSVSGKLAPAIQVIVADAEGGGVISQATVKFRENTGAVVLPLHNLFLTATIIIELSEGSECLIEIETINLT